MELPLKNVQTSSGKYALFFMNGAGDWQRIEKIGLAVKPFQVIATFDARPYVAVRKNGNIRNENDTRLYIINLRGGTVVDGCESGASRIVFDTNNKSIYFTTFASNGNPAQKYSWCLPHGAVPYMAINVPSTSRPGVQAWGANMMLSPVIEIAVVDFVPRAKRKRSRPRGSKNKPKVLSREPVVQNAPATPQIRKNKVSLRNTSRGTLGGVYDVYINGVRVATKRMNAHAKTFMNNRILAVSYQVPAGLTQNYDIYWPDGAKYYINGTHRLTGQPITVNSVSEQNNELKLGLSNNAVRVIRENDLARFAQQQFILEEKQK